MGEKSTSTDHLRKPGTQLMAELRLLLIVLVFGFFSGTASAQQKTTLKTVDQRLTRVENVLDQSLLQMLQRIDGLQQENRLLSGDIESLRHELQKLQQRNRDLYRDTDRRIGELEARPVLPTGDGLDERGLSEEFSEPGEPGGSVPSLDEDTQGLIENPSLNAPAQSVVNSTSGSVVGGVSDGPRFVSEDRSELTASDANNPLAPSVPVRGSNITRPATQAEKSAYSEAYNLLARGDNPNAILAFDQFLREFPDGPFSDNAWYWQGEAHYAARSFDSAKNNFNIVVNSFPESAKVPDSRLKIGYTLYEQGNYVEARNALTAVQNDYPGRSASVLARKRLQKMNREGN